MRYIRTLLSFLIWICIITPISAFAQKQSENKSAETIIHYLSGTDKDHTVPWEFYCTEGMNSGKWTRIPVPSNWELQGFGGYNYGHDKNKHQEKSLYKYQFKTDPSWMGKQIELVFEGVMTDALVKINGIQAGPFHQGAFYRFQYDISALINIGQENLLEVEVSKMSADSSVNRAEREGDFWVFGGIFRPVYLKILPNTFVERVAINAKADGSFGMDVFAEHVKAGDIVSAQVKTVSGTKWGNTFSQVIKDPGEPINLFQHFNQPLLWNPEYPNLYRVDISISRNKNLLHVYHQSFGFRTVEVRKGDGIYVNDQKIMLKGVDRHSFWPESGRTLSRDIHLMDIGLIKDMNMNAVRMSHYPPDAAFLDLCDSLGLFVLDELTGWQKKYATGIGKKLVKELVIRDVNHPSIIFWDNGNEGGFNTDLDQDYALYDPQQRTVLHPWQNFNNIDTKHYPDYHYVEQAAEKKDILLHTEMIHGLYDGGHGAGLEDYWNLFKKNPRHAGGFLWVLADEGIVRKDRHDSIDTDGNHGPDGITGPHREKEGSYYTIKEIWDPVQISKPVFGRDPTIVLNVENNYIYTDLNTCSLSWELVRFGNESNTKTNLSTVIKSGKSIFPSIKPGKKGQVSIGLPSNWKEADAFCVTSTDRTGRALFRHVWPIKTPADITGKMLLEIEKLNAIKDLPPIRELWNGKTYSLIKDALRFNFDTAKGTLISIEKNGQPLPLGEGPVLAGVNIPLKFFRYWHDKETYFVESAYDAHESLLVKWTFKAGMPVKMEYGYTQKDTVDFSGISFKADESAITGISYLGGGPFRVWKNRLKGVSIQSWYKAYNNTITGETYDYPEFKGYFSNLYRARIFAGNNSFAVYTETPNLFLQLFQPGRQKTVFNPFVNPAFPAGGIGFLHAIPPIGTKFKAANSMGPQSQKNNPVEGLINAVLWFDFK